VYTVSKAAAAEDESTLEVLPSPYGATTPVILSTLKQNERITEADHF